MSESGELMRRCEQRVIAAMKDFRDNRISLLGQGYALTDYTEGTEGVPRLDLRAVVGLVLREAGAVVG